MSGRPNAEVIVLSLVTTIVAPLVGLRAQGVDTMAHEHLTEVACVDTPPGEKRPPYGCFNVGMTTGLHFKLPRCTGISARLQTGRRRMRRRARTASSCTRAGGTTVVGPNIPMELHVAGAQLRRAFALVIHDSTQPRGIPPAWKPAGACDSLPHQTH